MVFGEYNYDEDVAVQREEAAEIASEIATAKTYSKYATKMLERGKSSEEIIAELMDIFDADESAAKKAIEAASYNAN